MTTNTDRSSIIPALVLAAAFMASGACMDPGKGDGEVIDVLDDSRSVNIECADFTIEVGNEASASASEVPQWRCGGEVSSDLFWYIDAVVMWGMGSMPDHVGLLAPWDIEEYGTNRDYGRATISGGTGDWHHSSAALPTTAVARPIHGDWTGWLEATTRTDVVIGEGDIEGVTIALSFAGEGTSGRSGSGTRYTTRWLDEFQFSVEDDVFVLHPLDEELPAVGMPMIPTGVGQWEIDFESLEDDVLDFDHFLVKATVRETRSRWSGRRGLTVEVRELVWDDEGEPFELYDFDMTMTAAAGGGFPR